MFKMELDVANEILAIVQNVDDKDDAFDFARIYIHSMQVARSHILNEVPGLKQFDEELIYNHIADVDYRFG